TKVTLVDHNTHPMYRQLDAAAGSLLADELTARGINLSVGNSVRMLLGTRSVEGVVLRDGTQIPCDTVILATGIVPNRDLAEQAGLAFGRGIKVNEFMQTSVEDVYAVGECCEFEGHVYGIVAPGLEQASIAVRRIGGEESSPYRKPQLATSLKVAGMSVFSLGDPQTRASLRTYTYREGATYRRVTLFGAYIESINAIGDWPELPVLRDLAQRRAWISPVKLWRFRRTGNLFSEGTSVNVGQWADTAIVCNCNSVSCGDLRAAVACGANSVQALTLATKAGGGCGSCQPLLREMLGSGASQESMPKKPWLSGASIVAGFVSLIALCLAIGYPDTVQLSWRWDELWRSSLFKQISGFSILGLTAVSLLVSLRKRIPKLKLGDFAGWRIAHISLTVLALLALGVHTGFRFGSNLNFALMMTFLGIALAGVLLGASIALEHRLAPALSMRLRSMGIWGHVLFLWPLPALLAVHVFKTYYF
ncbi:MAG: FAD-dependent oxidoreductase, partial [Pseudomonadota bacterium]